MAEHDGHRQRMLQKMSSGALLEHEWLEILLFNAVPRRNTNDLAHRLLSAFGSIKGIFSATLEQLMQVKGVGANVASYLVCIGKFYETYEDKSVRTYPQYFNSEHFQAFVHSAYAELSHEVLDFFVLRGDGYIVYRHRFTGKAKGFVEVLPEEFSKLLVEYKPAGVVAVHNHPSGVCKPSKADDVMTQKLQVVCSFHNVLFCDHFIGARDGVYSYYHSGRMKTISKQFSIGNIIGDALDE